jgi:putative copper resistance protein D
VQGDVFSLWLLLIRTGLNVSALIAIGLALHAALSVVEREGRRRFNPLALGSAFAVLLFTGARLLVLNLQMGDGSTLFDPDTFALSWSTLGSSTLILAIGALAIAAGSLTRISWLAGAGAVILAAGFAFTGHTQGLDDPGLAPLAVGGHVLLAGFWVAAPVTLRPSAMLSDAVLHARLARFSMIAVAVIPILVALGVWLAWRIAGGIGPLLNSNYGRLLLLKLAVAVAAMGLGAVNKQVITARILSDPPKGRRWLSRTLVAEAALFAVAILAVSAATTVAGPGE